MEWGVAGCDDSYLGWVRPYNRGRRFGKGEGHGRRVEVPVECDARAPAAAVAQQLPEMEAGDVLRQARGAGGCRRLLALSVVGAEAVGAVSAVAGRDADV